MYLLIRNMNCDSWRRDNFTRLKMFNNNKYNIMILKYLSSFFIDKKKCMNISLNSYH